MREKHICFSGDWLNLLFLCKIRFLCPVTPRLSDGSPVVSHLHLILTERMLLLATTLFRFSVFSELVTFAFDVWFRPNPLNLETYVQQYVSHFLRNHTDARTTHSLKCLLQVHHPLLNPFPNSAVTTVDLLTREHQGCTVFLSLLLLPLTSSPNQPLQWSTVHTSPSITGLRK